MCPSVNSGKNSEMKMVLYKNTTSSRTEKIHVHGIYAIHVHCIYLIIYRDTYRHDDQLLLIG